METLKINGIFIACVALLLGVTFFISGTKYQNGYVISNRAGRTVVNSKQGGCIVAEDFSCAPSHKENQFFLNRWIGPRIVKSPLTLEDYKEWQIAMR